MELAFAMVTANPDLELVFMFDWRGEPSQPTDSRPWSKVSRIRNKLLDTVNLEVFDYVLWIDADVIDYPADLPTQLINCNPEGMSAPLILIEGKDIFYDWAAFVMKDKDTVNPTDRNHDKTRQLADGPPYWPIEPDEQVVEMDCVGTITMVPAWIYRSHCAKYADHPAFTDHYPIAKTVRDYSRKVVVNRNVIARHADLPKFGEQWH